MQRDKPLPQFHHPRVPIRWSSIDETSSKFPYRAMLAFTRADLETASAAQTGENPPKRGMKSAGTLPRRRPVQSCQWARAGPIAGRHATGARSGQHPQVQHAHTGAATRPVPPTETPHRPLTRGLRRNHSPHVSGSARTEPSRPPFPG